MDCLRRDLVRGEPRRVRRVGVEHHEPAGVEAARHRRAPCQGQQQRAAEVGAARRHQRGRAFLERVGVRRERAALMPS